MCQVFGPEHLGHFELCIALELEPPAPFRQLHPDKTKFLPSLPISNKVYSVHNTKSLRTKRARKGQTQTQPYKGSLHSNKSGQLRGYITRLGYQISNIVCVSWKLG